MKYKIIQSTDPRVVMETVNASLKDGWVPMGGIAVASWFSNGAAVESIDRWAQAMTKGE